VIEAWHDRKIPPGTQWAKAIDDNLNKADIILLLISSKFLASEYCSDIEVKRAMERHNSKEARVIPIILRACDWSDEEFGGLQALPKNALPVTSWSNQDEAFLDIVQGIRRAISDLKDSAVVPVEPSLQPTVQNVIPVAEPIDKPFSAPTVVLPVPEVKRNSVELVSAKGIDYSELERLLESQQWYEADKETWQLMLKVMSREAGRYLSFDDIKNFPCEDLLTLDRLWVEYSKQHGYKFGFSVQKQIYVECGGRLDFSLPSSETWNEFTNRITWKREGNWLNYSDPFFDDNFMSEGHLPRLGNNRIDFGRLVAGADVLSRIGTCQL
jgi:hypothetical protein